MQKINFQNLPSTNTPLNETNLNQLQTNVETAINETKPSLAINNVDLNDYTDFGIKYFGTGCTNAPSNYIYVQTITNGGDATQVAYSVDSENMWKRSGAIAGGIRQWGNWEKFATEKTIIKNYENTSLKNGKIWFYKVGRQVDVVATGDVVSSVEGENLYIGEIDSNLEPMLGNVYIKSYNNIKYIFLEIRGTSVYIMDYTYESGQKNAGFYGSYISKN